MSIVLLDIGNVIVSVDFEPFCRAVSRDGELDAIRARYCEGDLKDRLDRGLMAPADFLGIIAEDPCTVDMPRSFFRSAWQRIFTPIQGCIEAVRYLHVRHEIWIMSDTDPLHFAFLSDTYPVIREADRYLLSFKHGYLKRQPEAFRHVLDSSGLDPESFILVDDREVNIESCRKAGMGGILFSTWADVLASPMLTNRTT